MLQSEEAMHDCRGSFTDLYGRQCLIARTCWQPGRGSSTASCECDRTWHAPGGRGLMEVPLRRLQVLLLRLLLLLCLWLLLLLTVSCRICSAQVE